jgi:hypothetical protein
MKKWKKYLAGWLALTLMGFSYPKLSYCQSALLSDKTNPKAITRNEPRIKSEPEKDIPSTLAEEKGKKGTGKWILYGLGAALVIGLAIGGAGGGGGGGGDNPPPDPGTGTISVGW